MSLLWIALGLILGVNIGLDDTTCRAGMIRCGQPRTMQRFDLAQFLQSDTAPILRRAHRGQTALALPAILIAQHPQLFGAVPA